MSEKRSGRGGVLAETPVFNPVFSLRVYVSVCTFVLSQCRLTSVDTKLHDSLLAGSWVKAKTQRKESSASSACSIVSCCLVCSGLHARYTDAFNGSSRFPSRHEQSLLDMNNVC